MRMVLIALPISMIILFIISETIHLRILHGEFYTVDIDLHIIGITLTFKENNNSKKSNKAKKQDINGYLELISVLLSYSDVYVNKFTPSYSFGDTPLTLFPSYIAVYSLLSALVSNSRNYYISDSAYLPSCNHNLDIIVKIRIYNVIISLLRYQYYKKLKNGGSSYV
jgi:hypothetical protein